MESHRLRKEIIATRVANVLVNASGTSLAFRLQAETGASIPDIAKAHTIAREIFDTNDLWVEIERLDNQISAATQTAMILEARKLLERATRWLLRHCARPLDIAEIVSRYRTGTQELTALLPGALVGPDRDAVETRIRELVKAGVPQELADRVSTLNAMYAALDLVRVADASNEPMTSAASVYFLLAEELQLHWLRDRILALPRDDRWDGLARDALRNDLFGWLRSLTVDALQTTEAGLDVEARMGSWLARRGHLRERCIRILDDIRASGRFDLATLSVALREVRNLAEAGRRPPAMHVPGSD
jgi:glutamate dehydrogenase